jgi:Tfp pilus assembly protein PilN
MVLIENTSSTSSRKILVGGIIYFLAIAVIIWILYALRLGQIKLTESKIKSLKQEVGSQLSEDELAQLEVQSANLNSLYGKPLATKILRGISSAIPRTVVITSINIAGDEVVISGESPSYGDVILFATVLNKESTTLKDVEVTRASTGPVSGGTGVNFSLKGNIK